MLGKEVKQETEEVLGTIPWAGAIVRPEDKAYIAWGARAIFNHSTGYELDFVGDRQGVVCVDDSLWEGREPTPTMQRFNQLFVRHQVKTWCKKTLDEYRKKQALYPDSRDIVDLCSPSTPFVGRMTPNGSHGYMYCAAWLTREMWDSLSGDS